MRCWGIFCADDRVGRCCNVLDEKKSSDCDPSPGRILALTEASACTDIRSASCAQRHYLSDAVPQFGSGSLSGGRGFDWHSAAVWIGFFDVSLSRSCHYGLAAVATAVGGVDSILRQFVTEFCGAHSSLGMERFAALAGCYGICRWRCGDCDGGSFDSTETMERHRNCLIFSIWSCSFQPDCCST